MKACSSPGALKRVDGGKSFDSHVRVNEDRPISHSFEGLSVADDGTVFR
jgi:hypothetical protein